MEELLPFLQKFEVWIYILLGAVALIPLQRLVSAWKLWQGSVFGLEREIAQRRFSTALTVLVLLVVFIFMEFVVVSFVAPSSPQVSSLPTATLDLLATPTVTLPAVVDAASTAATTTEVLSEGCIAGQIEWTDPAAGKDVSKIVKLKGTVDVPNLGFYKYEYSKQGEDLWNTIAAGNQSKKDEEIGTWNTTQLTPGDYRLRLVVADNQNKLFPACVIPVRVVQP